MSLQRVTSTFEAMLSGCSRKLDWLLTTGSMMEPSLSAEVFQSGQAKDDTESVPAVIPGQPSVRIKSGGRVLTIGILTIERPVQVVLLPRSAVGRSDSGAFVFRIEDGYLRRRSVTIETPFEQENLVAVTGLSHGDVVVSFLWPQFADGTPVFEGDR